ncbi:MAG: polyisoprenoid-binding protein [Chitinophagaceae bacterium]|nr:polyisoprenoid-binding protein [Chitinophagaceae bacterium]
MKKAGLILSAFAMLVLTAFTVQSPWKSDPPHSELGFSITHMGISDVTGTFNDFTATVSSSKEDFSDAVVEATINAASINTRVEARDGHLKGPDFFDAEKYPQITFKSTGIKSIGKGKYKLTGNLSAKGITKIVEMELFYRGTIEHPQTKKPVAGFKLSGTIKRSDFGIGSAFPAPMLGDEVAITVNAEFQQ